MLPHDLLCAALLSKSYEVDHFTHGTINLSMVSLNHAASMQLTVGDLSFSRVAYR